MNKQTGKTALLFGSFDPVHIGHLIIAEYFLNQEEIKEVWFVLTPHNPLKHSDDLSASIHRMKMLELALEGTEGYHICDIEFTMDPPHYTFQTLVRLNENYPEKEFVLLIGSDNLVVFGKWRNHEDILAMLPIYVYPRPGFETGKFDHYKNVIKTSAPVIDISSTMIRKNLASGLETRFSLPEKVHRYIMINGLYKSPNSFLS
jgi:nicotinate-nucleotide adenylyltransferase